VSRIVAWGAVSRIVAWGAVSRIDAGRACLPVSQPEVVGSPGTETS
jgi:hypothetical protein